ncbi:MAG: hypothetical protein ACLU77_13360 [Waltera sp.]
MTLNLIVTHSERQKTFITETSLYNWISRNKYMFSCYFRGIPGLSIKAKTQIGYTLKAKGKNMEGKSANAMPFLMLSLSRLPSLEFEIKSLNKGPPFQKCLHRELISL